MLRTRRECMSNQALYSTVVCLFAGFFVSLPAIAQTTLSSMSPFIQEVNGTGAVALVHNRAAADILVSAGDSFSVRRAAGDLQNDLERVTGVRPKMAEGRSVGSRPSIIIGTIGKSPEIDELIRGGQINVSKISGQWESYVITTVVRQGRKSPDVIVAGSDRRGTIYGIYEISEQIGVSPWYWFADVAVRHRSALFLKTGAYVQSPPVVKYRGLFINDEEPALGGWARSKFGGVNSKMYAHVFELLLRMHANFLWPAMWGKAFNEDDPADAKLADDYGIVMGTSHHEPLMRAQQEWTAHRNEYGNGEWNYVTNQEGLKKFWSDGVERNKPFEGVYTIGMRGDGDLAMPDAGSLDANKNTLESIIATQRKILAEHIDPDPTKVPQLWALFTEVQKYYDAGLRPPDDVTILFTDDNIGNLRRVPTTDENERAGGFGIYYHMDMNGGPFSYKWLNSNPLPKVWEQMNLAYQYGATRLWIVNIGDIKPLEVPLEFFLRFAWNPSAISGDQVSAYLERWATREFGPTHARQIASIVARYAKYNASPKPELVKPATFSLLHYREAERVWKQWDDLAIEALRIKNDLPAEQQDAYYELVLHPALASGNAVKLEIVAARNHLFAKQQRASTNREARLARDLYAQDQKMSDFYNQHLANGKWDHMMDQTHIGYTNWQSPRVNTLPALVELEVKDVREFGVAVEGKEETWPTVAELQLPVFDSLRRRQSYIEVFPRGSQAIGPVLKADQPWVYIKKATSVSAGENDCRYSIDVDWSMLPAGESYAMVIVTDARRDAIVRVTARKASIEQEQQATGAFGSLTGPITFAAAAAAVNVPKAGARWTEIPDYGREDSAMTIFPVTAASIEPGQSAPLLQYPIFLSHPGEYDIDLITNPTLDIYPGRPLAVAVSIDGDTPQRISVFTEQTQKDESFLGRVFYKNAHDNARILHFHQQVATAGRHTLAIVMVDPTVVVEKVIIHADSLPYSFFGPPVD